MRQRNERGDSSVVNLWTVLFVVFLVLKLTGAVAWSWWLVTAPLWGPVALGLLLAVVVGLFAGVTRSLSNRASVGTDTDIRRRILNGQHLN